MLMKVLGLEFDKLNLINLMIIHLVLDVYHSSTYNKIMLSIIYRILNLSIGFSFSNKDLTFLTLDHDIFSPYVLNADQIVMLRFPSLNEFMYLDLNYLKKLIIN